MQQPMFEVFVLLLPDIAQARRSASWSGCAIYATNVLCRPLFFRGFRPHGLFHKFIGLFPFFSTKRHGAVLAQWMLLRNGFMICFYKRGERGHSKHRKIVKSRVTTIARSVGYFGCLSRRNFKYFWERHELHVTPNVRPRPWLHVSLVTLGVSWLNCASISTHPSCSHMCPSSCRHSDSESCSHEWPQGRPSNGLLPCLELSAVIVALALKRLCSSHVSCFGPHVSLPEFTCLVPRLITTKTNYRKVFGLCRNCHGAAL